MDQDGRRPGLARLVPGRHSSVIHVRWSTLLGRSAGLKGNGIDDVDPVRQRLMNGTALRHLRQPLALGLVERSLEGHVRLDTLDPAIGTLVTAHAIIGVHAVVLELDVDLFERETLVAGIESAT